MPAILCVVKPLKGAFYNTSYAEAEKMVSAGRAYRPDPRNAPGVFYETAAAQAPAPVEEPGARAGAAATDLRDARHDRCAEACAPPWAPACQP